MCAEQIQRFLMAGMIALATWLIHNGLASGLYLMGFIIIMIIIWGIFDFCPSIYFIQKIGVPPCRQKTDKDNS